METYDVAIVGGGLAGISTAYFLAKAGKRCIVFEAEKIGSGATAATTAFITHFLDTSLSHLEKIFGAEKARLAWQSHEGAIDAIEHIVSNEKIECSFMRCPGYYFAAQETDGKYLQKEFEIARSLGFHLEQKEKTDLPFENFGSLEFKNQAKFSAKKYIAGLAEAARKSGASILEGVRVEGIKKEKDVFEIYTHTTTYQAKNIVIATYYPFGHQTKTHFKKGMYVSYVLKLKIQKGVLPYAIFEDTENPYNYFRVDEGEDADSMIIGGQDHRQNIPVDETKSFKALEEYVKKTFPGLQYEIISQWKGPIVEPSDGLALIGEIKENYYVATAFSGNGMTYSTIAGQLFCDLICEKKNPYQELYNPKRLLSLRAIAIKGKDYTEEFLHGAFKNAFK